MRQQNVSIFTKNLFIIILAKNIIENKYYNNTASIFSFLNFKKYQKIIAFYTQK